MLNNNKNSLGAKFNRIYEITPVSAVYEYKCIECIFSV